MSAYRDSLRPEQIPAYDQAMDAVAELVVRARARRDSLPADQAAREAYVPGGPSVEELTTLIERHRAEARAMWEESRAAERRRRASGSC
ncbi:hypothetical protein AB0O34_35570 [Sphaerisporangium sp. NPDC088356]|uniref:hypothetical protein n=1 Tax=Sphaerisporangium sp. NPDC088356 TaxID=3154871 RepID=UPI0034480F49